MRFSAVAHIGRRLYGGAFLSVIQKKVIRTSEQHVVTHCVTRFKVGIWCKELVLIDCHKWDGCRVISTEQQICDEKVSAVAYIPHCCLFCIPLTLTTGTQSEYLSLR